MLAIVRPICLLSILTLSGCSTDAIEDKLKCRKVAPGMTEAEVIAIMGKERSRHFGNRPKDSLTLFYRHEFLADGPVNVRLVKSGAGYVVEYTSCEPSK